MADQLYLFTGTNFSTSEITLALDSDNLQALVPGTEMGVPEHTNIWSAAPDNLGFRLLNHEKGNRIWPVRLLIGNKDAANPANSMQNAFQKLLRLIKQARRFEMEEDVDPVGLCVLLDGATNKTMFLVKDMELNGISVLDEPSRIWKNAQATFMMITEPLGFGEEEILENWVQTPHMQEDINADGLADNWNWSGTPVTSLDTAQFLCGSQSQSIIVDNDHTEGIYSDAVTCTTYQSDDFVSYIWVYRMSGSDEITFDVVGNNSGSLGTAEYGSATTTIVGPDGNTWSRLEVTGTIGAADTTVTLRAERLIGDAYVITRFYVDKAYLQFGVDEIPTGWCSQHLLYQHSHSAEGAVNYIDTEDILGDEEADTEFVITKGNVQLYGYHFISRRSNSREIAATGFFMDVTGDKADVARLGGTYWTDTPTGALANFQDIQNIQSLSINGKSGLYRVFMSAQDASADHATDAERADFGIEYVTSSATTYSTIVKFPQLGVGYIDNFIWLDLGIVDLSRHHLRHEYTDVVVSQYYAVAKRDSGSAAIKMDGILFMPIETDSLFVFDGQGKDESYIFHANSIDTADDIAYYKIPASIFVNIESLGRIPRLYPGGFSRTHLLSASHLTGGANAGTSMQSLPTYFSTVQIKYKPRTSFLFGVSDVT